MVRVPSSRGSDLRRKEGSEWRLIVGVGELWRAAVSERKWSGRLEDAEEWRRRRILFSAVLASVGELPDTPYAYSPSPCPSWQTQNRAFPAIDARPRRPERRTPPSRPQSAPSSTDSCPPSTELPFLYSSDATALHRALGRRCSRRRPASPVHPSGEGSRLSAARERARGWRC